MAAAMTRSASAMGSVVMGDMTDATIGSSGDRVCNHGNTLSYTQIYIKLE